MLGLPLGLWSKAGEVLGGLWLWLEDLGMELTNPGQAACQLWDLALPAPACCCASSSQAGLLIGCCVSLCSAGTEVVLESEMAGI